MVCSFGVASQQVVLTHIRTESPTEMCEVLAEYDLCSASAEIKDVFHAFVSPAVRAQCGNVGTTLVARGSNGVLLCQSLEPVTVILAAPVNDPCDSAELPGVLTPVIDKFLGDIRSESGDAGQDCSRRGIHIDATHDKIAVSHSYAGGDQRELLWGHTAASKERQGAGDSDLGPCATWTTPSRLTTATGLSPTRLPPPPGVTLPASATPPPTTAARAD